MFTKIILFQEYLEMVDACSDLWFMVLAWEQGNHVQVKVFRKNLQMSWDQK